MGTTKGVRGAAATGTGEAAGRFAKHLSVIPQVTSAIGFVLSGIQALLDVRAIVSSMVKYRSLADIVAAAKQAGHDPVVVAAVEYAAEQKFGKLIERAISFASAAISINVSAALLAAGGLALLAAGPAGWGVLASGVGIGLTVGSLLFQIGRNLYKRFTGTLSMERHGMAALLYQKGVVEDDPMAIRAIIALGPSPRQLEAAGKSARGSASQAERDKSQGQVRALNMHARDLEAVMKGAEKTADDYMTGKGIAFGQIDPARAAHHREHAAEARARLAAIRGQAMWKGLVHSERDVARLIFEKLGK